MNAGDRCSRLGDALRRARPFLVAILFRASAVALAVGLAVGGIWLAGCGDEDASTVSDTSAPAPVGSDEQLDATVEEGEQSMPEQSASGSGPSVRLETTMGDIVIRLYEDKAPQTVANFLDYVRSGFFDGTIFHRVIPGFMVQGGGFTPDMQQKPTADPIENEAMNGVENRRGTVAMARTMDPHSATAQFFINLTDNDFLNHTDETPQGYGYAVFGEVVEGMEVVDEIATVETTTRAPHQDVPVEPIVIEEAIVE